MKKCLFLLFAFLLNGYTFAQTRDTIRFENLAGLIKIPVRINGQVHYFMFDTGAETTAVREDVAAGMDKTNCSKKRLKDSNNKVTIQSEFVVQSLKIGNSDLNNHSIVTFPDSPMFNCLGFEGIIGVDIIKQFDWLIDFEENYLVKTDTTNTINGFSDFLSLDFYKNKLRPRIKLKIGNKVVDFLFDTGANENDIDRKNYRKVKNEIIKSYDEISNVSGANGYDRQSKESYFLVPAQPDNSDLKKHNVLFNTISVGENKIGNEFWGKNQIFLSWTKNKLLFRIANTEKEQIFGIFCKIINDSMVVNSLVYTGQIIESGVKTGDKVKSINGKSFKDYCELLMYQFLTKEKILTIEMQDGKQFTFKKEKLY